MDPLEPPRNDENSGFSRRRISSILKAPRKSTSYPPPEHQEILVECPKPVEKRNSRRVSFAPANNVLLFSNEVKHASPVRSPLQDLITTTPATQHRVHITEDEIQQITGMDTLLNAPLHAPQKRDKQANFHTEDASGEKTVMFSTEDAFMDMTHSQTINISRNTEYLTDMSLQSCDMFPTKEIKLLFDSDNGAVGVTPKNTESMLFGSTPLPTSRSSDPNSDIRSICSTVPSLDPGFENFLAGLFKSNGPPSKNAEVTKAGTSSEETQKTEVDKENQAPQSVRAVMDRSLNASRKMDTSLYGSVTTEAVQVFPNDDCSLFPTKEVFPPFGPTSQLKQSDRTAASFQTRDKMKLKNPSHQRDAGTLDKTIMFSAGDEFMDMTQSHTVNIANQTMDKSSSQKQHQHDTRSLPGASVSGLDQGFKDLIAGLSKTKSKEQAHEIRFGADDCRDKTVRFSADDACMDVTQSHTVNIATHNMYAERGQSKNAETISRQQDSRILGLTNYKAMETLKTASLQIDMEGTKDKFDAKYKTAMVPAEEAFMDVTQSHTVNIISDLGSNSQQNMDFLPAFGEKTVRFSANEAAMEVTQSHTVNILTGFETRPLENADSLPAFGEKTVRFSANEAAMDVTQSHTVKIISDLAFYSQQNERHASPCGKILTIPVCDVAMDETRSYTVNIDTGFTLRPDRNIDFIPMFGEKTVRFTESDAAMDVTRSHTVNIANDLVVKQNEDGLPSSSEKTVRFTDCDAEMDVTKSHTVKIASDLNIYSQQSMQCATSGEETVKFVADDGAMDETQCLTVDISTGLNPQSCQNRDFLPAFGERTIRFSAKEAVMDVTRSHTVNIASDLHVHSESESKHLHSSGKEKLTENGASDATQCPAADIDVPSRMDSAIPRGSTRLSFENMEFPVSLKQREDERSPAPVMSNDAVDKQGFLDRLEPQNLPVDIEEEDQGRLVSPVDQTVLDCPAVSLEVAPTEAGMDHHPSTDKPLQRASVNSCETKLTCEEISHKPGFDAHLTGHKDESEPKRQISPRSDDAVDGAPSRKSRRMSFADLHTKIRRLSHMISAAPDAVTTESCQAPLAQQEQEVDRNHQEMVDPNPAVGPECGPVPVKNVEAEQDQNDVEPTIAAETPFKLKTQQLMSRLSMGAFKAKLPQRAKASDGAATLAGEHTRTLTRNVTSQMSNFDANVSDINDEELDSCDDVSEVLDTKSPQKARVALSPPKDFSTGRPLEDNVFEDDFISAAHGKKSLFPTDRDDMEDEEKLKAPSEAAAAIDMGSQSCLGVCDSWVTSAPTTMTQATDESSSSHTASIRCEATFESTFKQSLFESQLEDYACDMQRKFDDGTITVLEFFKLFNIDFVIHNPRQSILPERLLSDTERTPLDSLKDRHIHHPKHKVYETDVQNLTEKVEGLKERMHDLDKPLRIVNKTLWEEMSSYTEKELKSFGTKLKERNNFFRKASKVRSHQMKEALYSGLVKANQAEQQCLRETIEKADEMIRSLDGCVGELEAELAQVVEKGSEDSPSLNSLQHEMNKVTEALTDNGRQISELEVQMMQNSKKLKRLNAETDNLEDHIAELHMISEWRFGEASDSSRGYTFLYDTFRLQLIYENSNGKAADNGLEKRISHIVFQHHIDEEKSQDHARIVHKLLSQYTQGELDWVKKYPTGGHVPKLLRDVSLVVGHCRLLGEELRLLKLWGGLKLDILSISCVDTFLHIVFSSLKKVAKFEVVFSVSLSNYHYVLHVHSFKNMIGDTTLQQVGEIVASLIPGKNLLTKTIKKMFDNLLC